MKKLLLAAVAALATAMPAMATVDPNTNNLLAQIEGHGIEVVINTKQCEMRNIHGSYSYSYRTNVRTMTLCPGESVDAIDHSTVRHEVFHAAQHCITRKRGGHSISPILSEPELRVFVDRHLTEETRQLIYENYPQSQWAIELEAFAAESAFTAAQLMEIFDEACDGIYFNGTRERELAGY